MAQCQHDSIRAVFRRIGSTGLATIVMLALLGVVGLLVYSPSAWTATTPTQAATGNTALPSGLDEDEIRDYLARLPDERVRELLMAELARQQAAQTSRSRDENAFERLQRYLHILRERLAGVFARAGELHRLPVLLWGQLSAGGTIGSGRIVGGFVLAFIVAGIAEWFYRRATVIAGDVV